MYNNIINKKLSIIRCVGEEKPQRYSAYAIYYILCNNKNNL